MSRTVSPISGKPYGLAAVCRVWRLARSGVYRHQAPSSSVQPRRRGPAGPMADAVLLEAIRTMLADSPFHGEGHRKIWAELAEGSAGIAGGMASGGPAALAWHTHFTAAGASVDA